MTATETNPEDLSLKIERVIAAPPERVFNAWLDPVTLAKFMHPAPDMVAPEISNDPREGGRFDILMRHGKAEIPHHGRYTAINPHSRIAFTWVSPYSPEGSEVTLVLRPDGGGTHITLTHVKFFGEEERDNHEGGWGRILDVLGETLA
jgi:uncharacterized protein YndB with AHSA1/START domain